MEATKKWRGDVLELTLTLNGTLHRKVAIITETERTNMLSVIPVELWEVKQEAKFEKEIYEYLKFKYEKH